ncbi:hypothetical protein BDY19DRAFT_907467 [Irpex rosettiformis]|uniref:Uncharacterized protein n=1 Tax=Irpex rosettiformis TaxID=378272 RepID=A0ACB8U055_9APHY|nr:hypothetical protein BDY19DRAFT_907467 [Irpex rosettiformis]
MVTDALSDDSSELEDEDFNDATPSSTHTRAGSHMSSRVDAATHAESLHQSRSPGTSYNNPQEERDIVTLRKALYELQLENAALRKQVGSSGVEVMSLEHTVKKLKKRGKGHVRVSDELSVSEETDDPAEFVKLCARKYAVLFFPWVKKSSIDNLDPEPPAIDPNDPLQRLPNSQDTVSVELARQAELYALLASHSKVKEMLGDPKATWISDQFRAVCLDQKSKFITDAHESIGYIFSEHGLDFDGLDKPEKRRENRGLRALGPQSPQDFYCIAMYPVGHANDVSWLFKAHTILAIIRVGICGRTCRSPGVASNSRAGRWRLKQITPGLVAFAATTLVYLISGDSNFVTKDDLKHATTYDYMALFQKYEALLIRTREMPNTKALFQWLNCEIFGPSFDGSPDPSSTDSDDPNGYYAALSRNQEVEAMFGASLTIHSPPPSATHTNSLPAAPAVSTNSNSSVGQPDAGSASSESATMDSPESIVVHSAVVPLCTRLPSLPVAELSEPAQNTLPAPTATSKRQTPKARTRKTTKLTEDSSVPSEVNTVPTVARPRRAFKHLNTTQICII